MILVRFSGGAPRGLHAEWMVLEPLRSLEHSSGRRSTRCMRTPQSIRIEVTMLDLLYIAIAIVFFVVLWGFTKASERL